MGAATAQNQPTTNVSPPPNSINKGNLPQPSRSEAQAAAQNRNVRMTGRAKYCSVAAGEKLLHGRYRTMKSCERSKAPGNLHCAARPS
jgi:hypothetical protein